MSSLITKNYDLKNLDCASCAAKIERNLKEQEGVHDATVSFATSSLSITCDPSFEVHPAVKAVEPEVQVLSRKQKRETQVKNSISIDKRLLQILASFVLWLVGLIFHENIHVLPSRIWVEFALYGSTYLIVGWEVLSTGFKKIMRGQWMDEEILMSIATLGAIAIHELPEAIGVMLFYALGEYIQDLAVDSSRNSIQSLLELSSNVAHLVKGNETFDIDPEEIQVGDEIMIFVGEQIPLDGVIQNGFSSLDTSALTGESLPREAVVGDKVLAGMINLQESLRIKVQATFQNSSMAKMIEIVQDATNRKAKVEKFMTKFSRFYTPIVVILSAMVAVLPPLIIASATFEEWVYRGLSLLVISCPCALVISIPLGYFGGLGALSKRGILVKGAENIDVLAKIETVVFDKTGTLTKGEFKIANISATNGFDTTTVLEKAVIAENHSTHPIAQAIRKAENSISINVNLFESVKEFPGQGMLVRYDNEDILAGNIRLMQSNDIRINLEKSESKENLLFIAVNGVLAGKIEIEDEIKPEAKDAIAELRKAGVKELSMLSGDRIPVADKIAHYLGLDSFKAELLPEDKLNHLEKILDAKESPVAYLGDGINDAPALARADVGISMGKAGSDIAIESADVVLLTDDLERLPEAVHLSRFTQRIVLENIVFALSAKLMFIVLGILGITGLWWAVIADVGVALVAILNASRIIHKKSV